jgi:hypothetical protein
MSTPAELTVETLQDAVNTAAAFRSRRRLQPAGGEGDKVFPPTFAGAMYAIETSSAPRDLPNPKPRNLCRTRISARFPCASFRRSGASESQSEREQTWTSLLS